jgi:hypothetical protein
MSQYCYRDIVVAWKGLRTYGVSQLACTLERIAQAIHSSMKKAKSETRVPKARRAQMAQAWEFGYGDAGWGLKPCGLLTLARQWWLQADCCQSSVTAFQRYIPDKALVAAPTSLNPFARNCGRSSFKELYGTATHNRSRARVAAT